jgi:hypothetical protein
MATATYNLRSAMLKAWDIARRRAKQTGWPVMKHMQQALVDAWFHVKRDADRNVARNVRAQAGLEQIKASYLAEATALRAASMAGFHARCGMPEPRRSFSRGFYL